VKNRTPQTRRPHFLCVVVPILLGIPCCSVAVLSQTAKPQAVSNRVAPASAITAGLSADTRNDVHATEKYGQAIRELLKERKFEQLEQIAATARSQKTRFAGGTWKLYVLYEALKQPAGGPTAGDAVWQSHLLTLHSWAVSHPDSVTARIALAEAFLNYTQKLRADADSDKGISSTEDPWEVINTSLYIAQIALKQASELDTKCPHLYFVQQEMTKGGDQELLDKAVSLEPSYYPSYRLHALFLHPLWHGEEGAPEKFADQISARIGGKQGAVAYFEVAAALACTPGTNKLPPPKLSWDKVKQGYAALEELYGGSLVKLNQYACLAVHAEDMALAQQLFARVGDRWDPHTWQSKAYFESSKRRAQSPGDIVTARSASQTNMDTPEGSRYFQQIVMEFKQKNAANFRDCAQPLGHELGGSFDLFLKIANDGEVQQVIAWPETKLSTCVVPKLLSGSLTPPPAPAYWVKFPMQFP